jgi:hypothetical protein
MTTRFGLTAVATGDATRTHDQPTRVKKGIVEVIFTWEVCG